MNLKAARVTGFFSLPSPSLGEHNPSAYAAAMADAPAGAGSCAHCGMGIRHHVVVECEGVTAFIGTTCAERIGGEVAACVASGLTSEERAAREAKRNAKLAEMDAAIAAGKALMAARAVILAPVGAALRDGRNGFCDSMGADLEAGVYPSDRAIRLVVDILSKRAGRYGSKAYFAEAERLTSIFTEASKI